MARWRVLGMMVGVCACARAPEPEPLEWTATVERSWGETATFCTADQTHCSDAKKGASVPFPGRLETKGGQAVLRLPSGGWVQVGEATVLEGRAHAIVVTAGHATVEPGTSDLVVIAGGLEMGLGAGTALSVRARDEEEATVTLHRGATELGETPLFAGQTAHVEHREVDRRAVYAGRVSPVMRVLPKEPDSAESQPRGLGRVTARIPGTERIVTGVRVSAHHAKTVIRDGFARTEIEETLHNDTDRVLEGRYVFALPPRASLSRLALWVGDELVEGEIVEKGRAARIFKGIVDDTVRPRDPALLEWVSGSELSLKIFPIEPRQGRRVVIAYNEALPRAGGTVQYRLPLGLGNDRATPIDDFSATVDVRDHAISNPRSVGYPASIAASDERATLTMTAQEFVPTRDFVVEYAVPPRSAALSVFVPEWGKSEEVELPEVSAGAGEAKYFALELTAALPAGVAVPDPRALDRVLVVDRSFSQGEESLGAQLRIAKALLEDLDEDERFAVLVCDSACESYPPQGLDAATAENVGAARTFLGHHAHPQGASDVAEALVAAAARVERAGQIVYLGDGRATAGPLTVERIAERARGAVLRSGADVRLLGTGRNVDEVQLSGLASALGASSETVASEASLAARTDELVLALRTPVIERPALTLPPAFTEVVPQRLPNLRLGQTFRVVGKMTELAAGRVTLSGTLAGERYELENRVDPGQREGQNPLVPRLWAERRIAALQAADDAATQQEVVALSQRHHVASRFTSLLVLESERMFREFGVQRTQRRSPEADGSSSTGNLWGSEVGSAFGSGGLGLSGIGEGGGGRGEGIGLGSVATFGRGAGGSSFPGSGFGSGRGRLGGSHVTRAPRVRMGTSTVSGRLPPEVIQRITRQNFGRFRMCYEQGLARNPELTGRVTARFVIGRDGSVSSATNGGSDLPDTGVVSCVVRAFYGLSFPRPEGGIVTVVYPIVFSPGGAPSPVGNWSSRGGDSWSSYRPLVHHPGSEGWRSAGDSSITTARATLAKNPKSRDAWQQLVTTLVRHGRFDDAADECRELARLDPDNAWVHERLAWVAGIQGNGAQAATHLATALELAPFAATTQMRVARAYEAARDERRACAHWRAAVDLSPDHPRAGAEAARCRARLEGKNSAPSYDAKSDEPGWFEARVLCTTQGKRCPTIAILTPTGRLVTPWSPEVARASLARVALTKRSSGRYRTLLVGGESGAAGQVTIVVDGQSHHREFTHDGKLTTIVASDWR